MRIKFHGFFHFLAFILFLFSFLGGWIYVMIQWNIKSSLVMTKDMFSLERAGGFHLGVQI
jgi:hypothetical protein